MMEEKGMGFSWEDGRQPCHVQDMIAVAAYYKAEKRQFMPGAELHDWFEAEREIMALLESLSLP